MTVYVDADACPVTCIAERISKEHGIPVVLLCDTNHQLTSEYSTVRVIGAGSDAVDIALINLCKRGDIVVTQDYGVAALALAEYWGVYLAEATAWISAGIFLMIGYYRRIKKIE